MKTNVTKKTISELNRFAHRYARFLDKFGDVGLKVKGSCVFLHISPKNVTPGGCKQSISPPGAYQQEGGA